MINPKIKMMALFFVTFFVSSQGFGAPKTVQVATGSNHTCARFDDGTLQCWGYNYYGALGLGQSQQLFSTPQVVPLIEGTKISQIYARAGHSCAIFEGGGAKCWGYNSSGQAGLGTNLPSIGNGFNQDVGALPYIKFGTGMKVIKLALGENHTCALLNAINSTTGRVKCWGDNSSGQLGVGDSKNRGSLLDDMGDKLPEAYLADTTTSILDICAGRAHTCARFDDGSVKCWGDYTAIGSGNTENVGSRREELGDNLRPIFLGTAKTAKDIACGSDQTCIILNDGSLKCWGKNTSGALGVGIANSEIIGDAPGEMGNSLKAVSLVSGLPSIQVSCGGNFCCARFSQNAGKCWGKGAYGVLGIEESKDRGLALTDMGDNLPYVMLAKLDAIAGFGTGNAHTCAVLGNGQLKCWGYGYYGQLGNGANGSSVIVGSVAGQMGENLKPVVFSTEYSFYEPEG